MKEVVNVNIYTDGSYSSYDSRHTYGGFYLPAYNEVFCYRTDDELYVASNNVGGEILAAEAAMHFLLLCAEQMPDKEIHATINHDYEGVGHWATGAWRTKKQLTYDYARYVGRVRQAGIKLNFIHVKGHSGEVHNERIDNALQKQDRATSFEDATNLIKEVRA